MKSEFKQLKRVRALWLAVIAMVIAGCGSSNNAVLTSSSFEDIASNPYEIHVVSDTKAYILRYGSPSIWIVDPSVNAADEENFKIGEIDLSTYDSDKVPNMAAGVIEDGVLYVIMQAMDADFAPGQAYLAAIDIATDTELSIGAGPKRGLALEVVNPVDIDVADNSLLIAGVGRYGSSFSTPPRETEYTGGIEKISLSDYSSELLVDDGDASSSPYGQINGLTVISDTQAYFTGYAAWQDIGLYEFNPTTGAIIGTVFASANITTIATSPESNLWVGYGDFGTPEIQILDPSDNSEIDTIETDNNISQIFFSESLSLGSCDFCAVLVGVAQDYGSSDISIADAEAPYSIDQGYAAQDLSDIVGGVGGEFFYRLGRSNQHNITQYRFDNPAVVQWQFSTNP